MSDRIALSRRLVLVALPLAALGACSARPAQWRPQPSAGPTPAGPTPAGPTPAGPTTPQLARFDPNASPARQAGAPAAGEPPLYANETPALRALINKWADHYEVPRRLVHAQIIRESRHQPGARNGPYMGLMQIHPRTAQTMGFRGAPAALLDPDTNLRYAVKYLRGAYLVARGDEKAAMRWYAQGYYYEAKRLGLLKETGLV